MSSWMKLRSLPPLGRDELYPLFNRVSLETIGRCTRECVFCPSRFRTKKQRGTMSDEVFDVIMIQLNELKFDGVLQLFYLGEPMLDPKIVERVWLAREACPKATLLLTSNGDLLKNVEQIDELFEAGLNTFNVDCYDDETYSRLDELAADCDVDVDVEYGKVSWRRKGARSKTLAVVDVSRPETHRAGCCHTYLHPEIEKILSEKGMLDEKQKWCAQPHRRLVTWWDGTIALCCVVTPTIKSPPVVGTYENLLEAWNNPLMNQYRYWLQQGTKRGVCVDCYYRHAYPHVMRRILRPLGTV